MKNFVSMLFCAWASCLSAKGGLSDSVFLYKQIMMAYPSAQIRNLQKIEGFQFAWEIIVLQDLDHWDRTRGTFPQRIILLHRGFKNPNVLVTEGYEARLRIYEATSLLNANQIMVEFRYAGKSKPSNPDWRLLNHAQALEDLHKIRLRFGTWYKKAWVATGISKGGTTASLYALTYPKDIKAAIAYVAPFPLAQEDARTIDHYKNKIGTDECRKKVFLFQREILQHRDSLRILLKLLAEDEQVSFPLGLDKVIDYSAVEFPFSFWQWGGDCNEIPDTEASAKEVFDYVEQIVDFNYYDSITCETFLPAYYQFLTEYGYYGFDTTGLSDLLVNHRLSNLEFTPKDATIHYDGAYMRTMADKATNESRNIIYIYGELDTWTACGISPAPGTRAIKLVKTGGSHRTRLRDFDRDDRVRVYNALRKWTKTKIYPLN